MACSDSMVANIWFSSILPHFFFYFLPSAYQEICDDCHPNAECVQDPDTRQYRCQCASGYRGDGLRCEPEYQPYDCRRVTICDPNARCLPDSDGNYVCQCNSGFIGNNREILLLFDFRNIHCHSLYNFIRRKKFACFMYFLESRPSFYQHYRHRKPSE